ncbi:small GTP-binding protein [Longilinea arvoryzae]|uniref:Small GTP-binding protein n=1 Tax=Longilinea arvoryzae TaxID=360412 RepID=A0A0S7BIZ5_9CHLR|nr:GTPase [Longilinea arvoryzae]GAP15593.1 small GTP-binding protein [Longilinea arvoryzae]
MTDEPAAETQPSIPESRGFREIWDALTPEEQASLTSLMKGLPGKPQISRSLVQLAENQLKLAFGRKHCVAIVGPANVGKSTLYNQFVRVPAERADVSPLPGTTRENQETDAGLFALVDTPGADAVGEVGERERKLALEAAAKADILIIVFDAIQGVKQTELELYTQLKALRKPHVVALNKIDLVRKEKKAIVEQTAGSLQLKVEQVIPIAARSGENLNQLLAAVAMAEPSIVAALGAALPQYRWQLAWRSIVSAATISAGVALTPLPVIDFVPLIATQSLMVLSIARIYNYRITLERARELVAAFGVGFLGRTLFYELSKLGGIPGWVLAAAVASSTTVAMGYAAVRWFEKGEKLSSDALKKLSGQVTQSLLQGLRNLGSRKPARKALQAQIEKSLEEIEIDRSQAEEE